MDVDGGQRIMAGRSERTTSGGSTRYEHCYPPHQPPLRSGCHSPVCCRYGLACAAQAFVHSNHVPLLFRVPGPARPQRLTAFAENVDIMPTLADLAGITVPPLCATEAESLATALCTEGRSLAPLIDAPAAPTAGLRAAQQVTSDRPFAEG